MTLKSTMTLNLIVLGAMVAAISALPGRMTVSAHHSVAAGFEMEKAITVTGTITKMEWRNPHARLTVDAKDEKGQVQPWDIWFGSANSLYRRGWHQDDLPVGASVTVTGFRARDGSRQIYGGGQTKLPDGRTLFGGDNPAEGQ